MNRAALALPADAPVVQLAQTLAAAGGRLIIVGGWVRDRLRGADSKDFDLEVFGLSADALSQVVRPLGFTEPVGKQFPIWRRTRDALDLARPRGAEPLDSSAGDLQAGGAERVSEHNFNAAFRVASRHRDLTVNAMGWDPLSEALIDPWRGEHDLGNKVLRAVDEETFAEDPLRLLRVARLAAQLGAKPDKQLQSCCAALILSGIPVERITGELRRMLCEPERPSVAFRTLADCGRLDVFPLVAALRDVPQDPRWHPEGDVYVHTLMVLDEARRLGELQSREAREILMLAALAHDFGKPETTHQEGARVRAHGHEGASAHLTKEWLQTLRFSERIVSATTALVEHHLAPAQFIAQGAGARAYRRLARKLDAAGVSMTDLERLARADHLGRTTEEALSGTFRAGEEFLDAAQKAHVREGIGHDCVQAKHLLARGMVPGPTFGKILRACRSVQDETGWQEADRILDRALKPETPPRD